jgi:hypothetical protein
MRARSLALAVDVTLVVTLAVVPLYDVKGLRGRDS